MGSSREDFGSFRLTDRRRRASRAANSLGSGGGSGRRDGYDAMVKAWGLRVHGVAVRVGVLVDADLDRRQVRGLYAAAGPFLVDAGLRSAPASMDASREGPSVPYMASLSRIAARESTRRLQRSAGSGDLFRPLYERVLPVLDPHGGRAGAGTRSVPGLP
jgi:hypothetical protein